MVRILLALFVFFGSSMYFDRFGDALVVSLAQGEPLKQDFWTYQSSGLTPLSKQQSDMPIAQIYAGTLRINQFGVLTSPKSLPISDIEIKLSSKSDPIHILLQKEHLRSSLDITPSTYQLQNNGDWFPCTCAGTFRIYVHQQQTWLQVGQKRTKIAPFPLSSVEISSKVGTAHLEHIQILDEEYGIVYKKSFLKPSTPPSYTYLGSLLGGIYGLLLGLCILRKYSWTHVLLITVFSFPSIFWVIHIEPDEWSILIQKLYLTQTSSWELARIALCIALIPTLLIYASLLPLRRTILPKPLIRHRLSWFLYGTVSVVFLMWTNMAQPWGWFLLWEFLFLLLPLWLWRNIGINRYLLITEIPTILSISILGWGLGLFLAVLWRMIVLLCSIPMYREYNMTKALDCIALTVLFIPTSLETTIRSTYLNKAWDVQTLTAKYNQEDPSEYLISMWNETCGEKNATQKKNIVFVGGSSTGGVFQFRQTPHLFFAGHTHTYLCTHLGSSYTINTKNYGRAAMDTHIIAQSFDSLLHTTKADLVVMYVGNNDVLTRKSPLSKRQLQQRMEHWKSQISGIKSYTSSSRLIIGSSLIFRQLDQTTKMVVSVPTYDAKENFASIAEIAKKHNTQVLLLTEFINPSVIQPIGNNSDEIDIKAVFTEYASIQKNLANQYTHVHYLDTWSALAPFVREDLFIDSNHLNVQGNKRVADVIAPTMLKIIRSTED